MAARNAKAAACPPDDAHREKYYLVVAGIELEWGTFDLRDLVKEVTPRIRVDCSFHPIPPNRLVNIGFISVNGREDAQTLYTRLKVDRTDNGNLLSIHVFETTDDIQAIPTWCNCRDLGLNQGQSAADNLQLFMTTMAKSKEWDQVEAAKIPPLLNTPAAHHSKHSSSTPLILSPSHVRKASSVDLVPAQVPRQQPRPKPRAQAAIISPPVSIPTDHLIQAEPAIETKQPKSKTDSSVVHIGHLNCRATEQDLKEKFFHDMTPQMIRVGRTEKGKSRGFARVTLASVQEVSTVVRRLNGKWFMGYQLQASVLKDKERLEWRDQKQPRSLSIDKRPLTRLAEESTTNSDKDLSKRSPVVVNGSTSLKRSWKRSQK